MLSNRDWAECISDAWGHDSYRRTHGQRTAAQLLADFRAEALKGAADRAVEAVGWLIRGNDIDLRAIIISDKQEGQ